MGGNVVVVDSLGRPQKAGKADFRKLNRDQFINEFTKFFKRLDSLFERNTGEPLWPAGKLSNLMSSGVVFSGSSVHLFNKALSDEEFVLHKPTVGDIDVTIPEEKLDALFEMLNSIHGTRITPKITYVGQKPSTSHGQLNALFAYAQDENTPLLNIQIDFEGIKYEQDKPSEFVKFSRSSDWGDIKGGVKGVFHKYLLRCIATTLSAQQDVVLLTPASPLEPPEKIKISKVIDPVHLLSFSVDKGLRTAAEQQFLPDGSPLMVDGKRAFKKLPTESSTYQQDKSGIFTLLFGVEPVGNELALFGSFNGLLQIMQDHLDNAQILDVYNDFIGFKLYGKSGQALDAYDPKNDMQAKMPAVNAFKEKFPFLSSQDNYLDSLIEDYYKNYKVRVIESVRRKKVVVYA
jgi:hypothetical protein